MRMNLEIPETKYTRRIGIAFGYSRKCLLSVAWWVSEARTHNRQPWAMGLASLMPCDTGKRIHIVRFWF